MSDPNRDERQEGRPDRLGGPDGGGGHDDRGPQIPFPREPRRPKPIVLVLLAGIILSFFVVASRSAVEGRTKEVTYVQFLEDLKAGRIKNIEHTGNEFEGDYKEGGDYKRYRTIFPENLLLAKDERGQSKLEEILGFLTNPAENYKFNPPSIWLAQVILPLIPWLVLFLLAYYFLFRQIRSPNGPGGVLSFGRSRAKRASRDRRKVTFKDVAGIEEAVGELNEIVEFLKTPKRFEEVGARIPRGCLLIGPPGTGKTLLAKGIAGEADVPFFSISGSDFVEMFVGVGASRVRDLFREAKENAPCIVFLDEIDAVGRRRGSGLGGGHDEREQTLNAILVEMDGFDSDDNVIVLAATNRPDVLDPALLRPGRFDRSITIDLPDVKGREGILKVHARKVKMAADVDLAMLAKGTPMFSGADLEATINEAALIAVLKKKKIIDHEDLEEARDKVRWGRQNKSRVVAEEDRRITAFHEAGHAIAAKFLPGTDPVHRVTIIPRGRALGATMMLPDRDRYSMAKQQVLSRIKIMYGGRLAEELFCEDISAGAQNDIKQATDMARLMVCEWGMTEALGPVNYSETEETLFLGREISRTRNHSETTALEIDREVRRILDECYEETRRVLTENKDGLERLAHALLEHEVLNGHEVDVLVAGGTIPPRRVEGAAAPAGASAESQSA